MLVGPRVEFVDSEESRELTHLIMVPGHGVTMTESLEGADSRDADWFLLDYQKERDVPRALVGHIRGGLDELDADRASLLLFSGEPPITVCLFLLFLLILFFLRSCVPVVGTTHHTREGVLAFVYALVSLPLEVGVGECKVGEVGMLVTWVARMWLVDRQGVRSCGR